VPGERAFLRVDASAEHFTVRRELRPAVRAAVDGLGDGWTTGLLHADPHPGHFLRDDRTGRVGVIDWDGGYRGPLLYDLASAVMYSGPAVIGPYLNTGVLTAAEVDAGLERLLRFRFAVQADYFCRRTATGDLTGIDGPEGNAKGLADAERMLLGGLPAAEVSAVSQPRK
jgi:homoserine kinase type II